MSERAVEIHGPLSIPGLDWLRGRERRISAGFLSARVEPSIFRAGERGWTVPSNASTNVLGNAALNVLTDTNERQIMEVDFDAPIAMTCGPGSCPARP